MIRSPLGERTVEQPQPSTVRIFLAIENVIELSWLVVKQSVCSFPARKVLESLQESDVCVLFALIEGFIDPAVVELAEVYGQVQWDGRKACFPGLTDGVALRTGISAPGDLERLRAVSCFCFCCGVDGVQRSSLEGDLRLPLGCGAVESKRDYSKLEFHHEYGRLVWKNEV
jgi:hypothetical protein